MDDSLVILWGADVGGIFEGDPGMAGLEDHGEDLAPDGGCLDPLEERDLTAVGHGLILAIALLKSAAVEVVQVGNIARTEEGPLAVLLDPLHEEVGDPVGGIHVVGAAALVAHVLAKFEEVLDVEVPGLQVGAHRPFALAALVDGDGGVVGDLEEGNDSLALTVGTLDEGAGGADVSPVIAESAGPLRELRVIADALEDVIEVIHDRRQIARAELRVQGAAIKEGRCGGSEEEAGEEFVELDRALVLLLSLIHGKTEADAHPEELGRLEAVAADVNQVSIINGLQSHVVEEEITLGLEGRGDLHKIKLQQARSETSSGNALFEVGLKAGSMGDRNVVVVLVAGKGLAVDHIQKETSCHIAIGWILLDAGLGGENHRLLNLVDTDAIIEAPHRLVGHLAGLTAVLKPTAGTDQGTADTLRLQDLLAAITKGDMKFSLNLAREIAVAAQGAGLASILTVNDVPAGHLDVSLHHEGLLHGILNTLDLEFLTTGCTTEEALDDGYRHRKSSSLILRGKGIITRNIAVSLEGALHGKSDPLLVEGFAAAIALADDEFATLQGVDSAQGELSGEWFHGFRERFWVFWEKVHYTLYVVSCGRGDRNL